MRTDQEVRAAHARTGGLGVAVTAGAALLGGVSTWPLLDSAALIGATAGSVTTAAAVAHHRFYFAPRRRLRRELGGPVGWLDAHDLTSTAGATAVRRHAAGLWPHRDLARLPVTESGWEAGRLVSGPRHLRRRRVYSPWTRGIGILGPQGSGKTQYLIRLLLDAPGAVVAPSTKPELAEATMALRARRGPVHVFNPTGLGHLANTFTWNPVSGCEDQAVADRRAWALVRGGGAASGTERAQFWAQKAQEIVRAYLMAAALTGADMTAVMGWANNPDDPTPTTVLTRHPAQVPTGWVETLRSHLGATPNTRTGYFAAVIPSVGFMDNPAVAAACRPAPGEGFDVHEFLASAGTLYLVGGAGDQRLAPLLTALTEYMFDSAQRVAAGYGGRLPTTLAFLLDEVANTTPVPLDRWAADSRGWGITVCAVVQSLAQLSGTWGPDAADVIWENLPTQVILPGVANPDDLRALSFRGGQRWVTHHNEGVSEGADGRASRSTSTTRTREPVIDGGVIANMPPWHAYILGLARHPALVQFEPGHRRVTRATAATPAQAHR